MTINAQEARDLLETLAINHAADSARQGYDHASRIGRLKVNSWQAEILRNAHDIRAANNPSELRALMGAPEVAVVFLPQTAMVTAEIIDRICSESSLSKTIIWETND